jgi:hypothetical protein
VSGSARVSVALPALAALLLGTGCGRLGFSEQAAAAHRDGAHQLDPSADAATLPPPLDDGAAPSPSLYLVEAGPLGDGDGPDASAQDAGTPASSDAGAVIDASAAADDAGQADASLPPPPPPPMDDACNPAFPYRMWPVASDVASCTSSFGVTQSTTGPNSADYTVYGGCSTVLEFATTPDLRFEVRAFGDGCVCTNCSLWHVHYQLEEDLGNGFTPMFEVQEPDSTACANGNEVNNYTSYRPLTSRVRLRALAGTTGAGFYFVVCTK